MLAIIVSNVSRKCLATLAIIKITFNNLITTIESSRFVLLALTVCILAAFCTSCATHNVPISYDPGITTTPSLPCSVVLRLSKEFVNYEHVNPSDISNDEFRAPYGPAFQKYAIYVAQSVFGDVQVFESQPPNNTTKLLIVPRIT